MTLADLIPSGLEILVMLALFVIAVVALAVWKTRNHGWN
jgi:hypothetical protein